MDINKPKNIKERMASWNTLKKINRNSSYIDAWTIWYKGTGPAPVYLVFQELSRLLFNDRMPFNYGLSRAEGMEKLYGKNWKKNMRHICNIFDKIAVTPAFLRLISKNNTITTAFAVLNEFLMYGEPMLTTNLSDFKNIPVDGFVAASAFLESPLGAEIRCIEQAISLSNHGRKNSKCDIHFNDETVYLSVLAPVSDILEKGRMRTLYLAWCDAYSRWKFTKYPEMCGAETHLDPGRSIVAKYLTDTFGEPPCGYRDYPNPLPESLSGYSVSDIKRTLFPGGPLADKLIYGSDEEVSWPHKRTVGFMHDFELISAALDAQNNLKTTFPAKVWDDYDNGKWSMYRLYVDDVLSDFRLKHLAENLYLAMERYIDALAMDNDDPEKDSLLLRLGEFRFDTKNKKDPRYHVYRYLFNFYCGLTTYPDFK